MGDREGSGRGGRGTGVNPLKRDWRGEEEMGFAERKWGFGKGENEPRRSEAEEGRHWRSSKLSNGLEGFEKRFVSLLF